jgi:N-acyl-D-aspartate/D-glutamate deacylase
LRHLARSAAVDEAPGYKADINVIDFDNLTPGRPLIADLPPGGRCVMQPADGYLHTFVNGVEVNGVEINSAGQDTGELVGRLVRGPRPDPAS